MQGKLPSMQRVKSTNCKVNLCFEWHFGMVWLYVYFIDIHGEISSFPKAILVNNINNLPSRRLITVDNRSDLRPCACDKTVQPDIIKKTMFKRSTSKYVHHIIITVYDCVSIATHRCIRTSLCCHGDGEIVPGFDTDFIASTTKVGFTVAGKGHLKTRNVTSHMTNAPKGIGQA